MPNPTMFPWHKIWSFAVALALAVTILGTLAQTAEAAPVGADNDEAAARHAYLESMRDMLLQWCWNHGGVYYETFGPDAEFSCYTKDMTMVCDVSELAPGHGCELFYGRPPGDDFLWPWPSGDGYGSGSGVVVDPVLGGTPCGTTCYTSPDLDLNQQQASADAGDQPDQTVDAVYPDPTVGSKFILDDEQ